MLKKLRHFIRDHVSSEAGQAVPPPDMRTAGLPPGLSQAEPRVSPTEVFTPTKPRSGRLALVGRRAELTRVLEALIDESAHVVIYAERGRGKTSLANLTVERLRREGAIVGRYVCDATSTFDQIMAGLLRDLPSSLLPPGSAEQASAPMIGCGSILPKVNLRPADIATVTQRLSRKRLVFVIDEFDRVEGRETRTRIADTIKLLSDQDLKLSFMIVGVSSTLYDIIGQHASIERNITGVHLPLLERREIEELLATGAEAAGVVFSTEHVAIVADVSRGMPYMAQLMGLRIVQRTLKRGDVETSREDVAEAIALLIADAMLETATRYTALVSGPAGDNMRAALDRIAVAPQDRWGRTMPIELEPEFLTRLIDERIVESCPGLPDWLQVADRRLINHVMLLRAQSDLAASAKRDQVLAANL